MATEYQTIKTEIENVSTMIIMWFRMRGKKSNVFEGGELPAAQVRAQCSSLL